MPIFSSQVIQRYDKLQYKGLKMVPIGERPEVVRPKKGLTGIAAKYEKEK